jgi:hypothetical protein
MSNKVSTSAASSASAIFNTIGTTARVLTTTVDALGNLAEELNLRSQERLHNVQQDISHDRIYTDATRRKDNVIKLARSFKETEAELARDPALKTHFENAMKAFAVLDPAETSA